MHHIRRIAAVAVMSGVAVASLAAPATAARPHRQDPRTDHDSPGGGRRRLSRPTPRRPASRPLRRQLRPRQEDGGYANYGETADAILSMDAAGVAQAAAHRATAYLEAHVKSYAGHDAATYAPGPIGKLLLVAEAQHVERPVLRQGQPGRRSRRD